VFKIKVLKIIKVHNANVYKGESKIVRLNSNLVVGDGLFASKNILKADDFKNK
jgi:hypothetical protein